MQERCEWTGFQRAEELMTCYGSQLMKAAKIRVWLLVWKGDEGLLIWKVTCCRNPPLDACKIHPQRCVFVSFILESSTLTRVLFWNSAPEVVIGSHFNLTPVSLPPSLLSSPGLVQASVFIRLHGARGMDPLRITHCGVLPGTHAFPDTRVKTPTLESTRCESI